ncbi:hypothetical protein [Coprobacter tertius]|uniref:Lipoprotein n=1 Tax=Coprobacter tertius TaxID=2944915 RepID=A0ABT1MI06_9BACT|nr:hypothetical protein [Coprobacter tertius]MCP9610866.1 hypothetical protein [Coprobacter tertius]
MASMISCKPTTNNFSKAEKISLLDTLSHNFSTDIVDWVTEYEPNDELLIVSMSLISAPALLEEYKKTGGIENSPSNTRIDEFIRLKILPDYMLTNENNDTLKIRLTDTSEYYFNGGFSFSGLSLCEKNNELYFKHWIRLDLDAAFKQLKGYINIMLFFPENNMKRKIRIPVNASVYKKLNNLE